MDLPSQKLWGVPLYTGNMRELLSTLEHHIEQRKGFLSIFTPNPEQFVFAHKHKEFLTVLRANAVNLPDGAGVVWALRRHRNNTTAVRIAGREVFHALLVKAKQKHWRVCLVGGKAGSARAVIEKYGEDLPWVYDPGAVTIARETPSEKQRVLRMIARLRPHLVFIAYGAPWQEQWIASNQEELRACGVQVAMAVGGSFEYEAGKVPLPSTFVVAHNLEWLQRLIVEPWRWKRQLIGAQFFFRELFGHS